MSNAVVIGSSMGGLIAAAVAARHFRHVTLIDKEYIPAQPKPRKSVPQGRHVHALLKSGELFLSELFPGFREAALRAGCLEFRVRSQWRTYGPRGWIEPVDTGLTALSQTRPLIEHVVRRFVDQLDNVEYVHGTVSSIISESDGPKTGKVATGVELSTGTVIKADLTIDASGRSGGTDKWLQEMAGLIVPSDEYAPQIRYASALFSRQIDDGPDYGGWLMFTPAPARAGAVALPVENNRWLVTAYTRLGESVPTDENELRQFLLRLPDTKIAQLIGNEKMVSTLSRYAIPKVVFRRFDKVSQRIPAGYVPLGDSIATFSPINAQGMSVAALQAQALDTLLTKNKQQADYRATLVREYVEAAAIPASWAWTLCQSLDNGFPELHDQLDHASVELASSIKQVAQHSASHPELIGAMGRALHLLDSPSVFSQHVRDCLAGNSV